MRAKHLMVTTGAAWAALAVGSAEAGTDPTCAAGCQIAYYNCINGCADLTSSCPDICAQTKSNCINNDCWVPDPPPPSGGVQCGWGWPGSYYQPYPTCWWC